MRRQSPREGGQSLVEFALIFPIFVLMLFGLIDMGRAPPKKVLMNGVRNENVVDAVILMVFGGETAGMETQVKLHVLVTVTDGSAGERPSSCLTRVVISVGGESG